MTGNEGSEGCTPQNNVVQSKPPTSVYLRVHSKLPELVYDILPPTTVTVDYATGLETLSANERFFNDAQTAVNFE